MPANRGEAQCANLRPIQEVLDMRDSSNNNTNILDAYLLFQLVEGVENVFLVLGVEVEVCCTSAFGLFEELAALPWEKGIYLTEGFIQGRIATLQHISTSHPNDRASTHFIPSSHLHYQKKTKRVKIKKRKVCKRGECPYLAKKEVLRYLFDV